MHYVLGLTKLLMDPGKVPGCSGTRNLNDNISDIRAQIAANQKGIHLVCELIDAYSLKVVQAYMGHIQVSQSSHHLLSHHCISLPFYFLRLTPTRQSGK